MKSWQEDEAYHIIKKGSSKCMDTERADSSKNIDHPFPSHSISWLITIVFLYKCVLHGITKNVVINYLHPGNREKNPQKLKTKNKKYNKRKTNIL